MRLSRQSWLHRRTSSPEKPHWRRPFLSSASSDTISIPFLVSICLLTINSTVRSLKELSKAIVAFLSHPVLPLPDDLSEVLEGYLRRHQKYDDAASDRLQEELFSIYNAHVKENSTADAPWLAVLRQLFPVLRTADRIFAWWDTTKGLLEKANPERDVVEESFAGMKDIIALVEESAEPEDADLSNDPFINRLLSSWMNKLYPATCEGIVTSEHLERLTRDTLVHFGKRHPKVGVSPSITQDS